MSFVIAINPRGEKQRIPAHWIGHPVLGRNFRLPASAAAGRPQAIGGRRRKASPVDQSDVNPAPDTQTPVSGGDVEKEG